MNDLIDAGSILKVQAPHKATGLTSETILGAVKGILARMQKYVASKYSTMQCPSTTILVSDNDSFILQPQGIRVHPQRS